MTPSLAFDLTGSGPRLVLIHGFTQTKAAWGPFASFLSARCELVLIDAPGHGQSSQVEAGVAEAAALIGWTGRTGAYLGYSMGGRLALRLALDQPDRVERLVLIGASPGIDDDAERHERAARDDELANHLEAIGLDAFLEEWLAQPLFATLAPDAAQIDARRANTVEGLASSLRLVGTGRQEPLWDRLHELTMPVLLVTGENDERFGEVAARMAERIGPTATTAVIADAGHAVHLERPEAAANAVVEWMG